MGTESTSLTTPTDTFDSADLASQLRDKIRLDVAKLMPEETWTKLLQSEIDKFFAERKSTYYRDRNAGPSPFAELVEAVMREESRARVKALLEGEEWKGFWDGEKEHMGAEIRRMITDKAGEIVANVLGSAMQSAVNNLRSQF